MFLISKVNHLLNLHIIIIRDVLRVLITQASYLYTGRIDNTSEIPQHTMTLLAALQSDVLYCN